MKRRCSPSLAGAVLVIVALALVSEAHATAKSKWITPRRPVVIIPGMAGSQLFAKSKSTGEEQQVWAVIASQEKVWKKHIWGQYKKDLQKIVPYDEDTEIVVPWEKDFGLFGSRHIFDISSGFFSEEQTEYLNPIMKYLAARGYEPGKTLWGCPYDWRYPLSHPPHVARLKGIIERAFNETGARVDIISHSSGCYLPMTLFADHPEFVEKHIHSFITCGCPFKGTPARVFEAFVEGYTFEHPFISVDAGQPIANEAGMLYEVLGDGSKDWGEMPVPTATWTINGKEETWDLTKDAFPLLTKILKDNTLEFNGVTHPLPFNEALVEIAKRENPRRKATIKPAFFYNMYSTRVQTPYKLKYADEITKLTDLAHVKGKLLQGDGDGTILTPSARGDWYHAVARMRFQGLDHMDLIKAPKAQEALGQFFDVECPWEGMWEVALTSTGSLRVDEGDRAAPKAILKLYPTGTMTVALDQSDPRVSFDKFVGTVTGKSVRGKARAVKLLSNPDDVKVSLSQDHFCDTFTGKLGEVHIKGVRVVGTACEPGARVACQGDGGSGFKYCVFGEVSERCEIHTCDKGLVLRGYPDKPEKCIKNPRLKVGKGSLEEDDDDHNRNASSVQFDEGEIGGTGYIEPAWRKKMRLMWYYTYALSAACLLCCCAFPGRWVYNYFTRPRGPTMLYVKPISGR